MNPSSILLTFTLLLIQNVHSANILGVFLFPSISHQIVYQPIWRELSLRGHNVTVVTPDPLNDSKLVNLTEIDVHDTYNILKIHKIEEIMSKDIGKFQFIRNLYHLMDLLAESELNNTHFQRILRDKAQKFDLVMIECFHPVMYALGARFDAPVISVSSLGAPIVFHDLVGNPTHPVLNPDVLMNFHNKHLTLWQKIESSFYNVWYRLYHFYIYMPRADKLARKYMGDDIPYLGDYQWNVSMLFLNVNPLLYTIRPNVPAIVELGQMHIKPVQPLPPDLKTILDEATEGVIYLSFGSNVKSVNIAESLRRNIIDALAELPYKILWKWESDNLPGKPPNVITRKWLPQQDVLAHPHVKAFVTQGGLQSTEEAISRGVPLIGMPFMGDQPMNVQKLIELGVAVGLDPVTATKDEIKKAIIEVAENNKYRIKIKEMRDLLEDQPMSGLQKAVWWSEYVIRHKGARHLRSPVLDTPWYHYFLLDVFAAVVIVPLFALYVLYKLFQTQIMSHKRNKMKLN